MRYTRSFLKWAGSKYRCLKYLLDELPAADRLIEPFAGSGSVFINAHFSHYLLAEQNNDLVLVFQHLKNEGDSFIAYCKEFFAHSNNNAETYYKFRKQFNASSNHRERAALFLYLNRHGYNGLCRYNQQGIYNVPFGRYTKPYFPQIEMEYFFKKSKHAEFIESDFQKTFQLAQKGDLIYCDPPYAPLSQETNFTSYTVQKFGKEQQINLAHLAVHYANQGIPVVLSNHDTEFTRHLYQGAEIKTFTVRRSIHFNPLNRAAVNELIAIFR